MKLYVWKDVLGSYSFGVIFAHANSVDDARQKVLDTNDVPEFDDLFSRMIADEPEVVENNEKYVYWVWGE